MQSGAARLQRPPAPLSAGGGRIQGVRWVGWQGTGGGQTNENENSSWVGWSGGAYLVYNTGGGAATTPQRRVKKQARAVWWSGVCVRCGSGPPSRGWGPGERGTVPGKGGCGREAGSAEHAAGRCRGRGSDAACMMGHRPPAAESPAGCRIDQGTQVGLRWVARRAGPKGRHAAAATKWRRRGRKAAAASDQEGVECSKAQGWGGWGGAQPNEGRGLARDRIGWGPIRPAAGRAEWRWAGGPGR